MKNCTPLWREAHLEVKMHKTPGSRSTFGSWDVKKVHAVVARSTFPSQNAQNTRGSDHFWRLRCRKSARRCGAKHENVQNTRGSDHFWMFRCRFASLHYTSLHYITLHYTTGHYTTLRYITLHYTTFRHTPLHYITLHYIPPHPTTPQYITLHS